MIERIAAKGSVRGTSTGVVRVLAAALAMAAGAGESSAAPKASQPARRLPAGLQQLAAEAYKSGSLRPRGADTGGGRTKVRQLLSFETGPDGKPIKGHDQDGQPIGVLMKWADDIDAVYVRDNGVTDGKWCARLTIPAGKSWGTIDIRDKIIKNWGGFDYFAFDLYTEDDHPYDVCFELWDQASRNYHTRCTYTQKTRPGKQTLLYRIDRAKRNSKEGREWQELEPKDKIDLNNLKKIKIFATPRKDRPARFWIDNLRLMQEDAAKPRMRVDLPKALAAAFDFGSAGATVPGFQAVTAKTKLSPDAGFGFASTAGLSENGKGWPDLLTGTYVAAGHNRKLQFTAKVPNGTYRAWLCAGPILRTDRADPEFLLEINGKALHADKPDFKAYDSEKYLYRFLWTQYSQRPHALWLDYVDRMFPVRQEAVTVTDGRVTITASNYFLSALILVPRAGEADFARMAAKILTARLAAFEKTIYIPERPVPKPRPGDGDYVVFVPDQGQAVQPWTGPTWREHERKALRAVAARGQNVILRLAVVPFKDLGACTLELSDLRSPGGAVLGKSTIRGHVKNYRQAGRDVAEMVLLPTLSFPGEKHVTRDLWLWLTVPDDAKAGKYTGAFTLRAADSRPTNVPVEVTVQPFRLEPVLPVSFGMYYGGRGHPRPPADMYWDVIEKQFTWMRKVGFTSTALMALGQVTGVNEARGKVRMRFSAPAVEALRRAGLGRHPKQMLMTTQLGIARAIARRLLPSGGASGSPVDSNPGVEMSHPKFKALHLDALGQWRKYLDSLNLPYAVEIVDEPREVPNPWNRNLLHTCAYGDWMKQAGFKTRFVTPMGDGSGGKDYTALVDHSDIISIHAWQRSAKMLARTRERGKTLWFYNCGMSRFMWGFYPWKQGAVGRWEWHWSWSEGGGGNGYPGGDWYNPFTGSDGAACNAPVATYPGGFLYKSAFLTAADGITDYAYVYTLERALAKHKAASTKADTVRQAEAFLKKVRSGIPEFPHGKEEGDLVAQLDAWRAHVARFLIDLQ